jgi:hypothetical protein
MPGATSQPDMAYSAFQQGAASGGLTTKIAPVSPAQAGRGMLERMVPVPGNLSTPVGVVGTTAGREISDRPS